jgi:hypothetical protein
MISIRWRKFERELRRRVRRKLRASKTRWREYRRRNNLRQRVVRWLSWPIGVAAYAGLAVSPLIRLREGLGDHSFGIALNLAALMWTGIALARSANLAGQLRGGPYLMMLLRFPVSDRMVFRLVLARFLKGSLVLGIYFFAGSLYLVAWQRGGLSWDAVGWSVVATLLQSVANMALSLGIPQRFQKARLGLVGVLLCLAGFIFGYASEWFAPLLLQMSDWLLWAQPAGWGLLLLHAGEGLLLVPLTLLVAAAIGNVRQLEETYQAPNLESLLPMATVAENFEAVSPTELREVTETLLTKRFLRGVDWGEQRWMERLVARWWTARERLLAEFLLGGRKPHWTQNWRAGLKVAAFGPALALLPGTLGAVASVGAFGVATLAATGVFLAEWPGLHGVPSVGPTIPIYALAPCGFWEIARMVTKANIIRTLAWLPAMVICGAVAAWRLQFNPVQGAVFGVRLCGVELLGQPIAIVLLFSARTNDTSRFWQPWAWMHALLHLGVLVSVVTAFVMLFAPVMAALLATVLFGLCTAGCLGLYALWYHRGAFDLMRIAPRVRAP